MTIPALLTPGYWFAVNPAPFMPVVQIGLFVLLSLFLIGGVVAFVLRRQTRFSKEWKRAFEKMIFMLFTTGIVGFCLLGIAYERVPYLSIRLFWLLWVIWTAWWKWSIIQYVRKDIPAVEALRKQREQEQKWLPKRKS